MKAKIKTITSFVLLAVLTGCGTLECGSQSPRDREIERSHFERNIR